MCHDLLIHITRKNGSGMLAFLEIWQKKLEQMYIYIYI